MGGHGMGATSPAARQLDGPESRLHHTDSRLDRVRVELTSPAPESTIRHGKSATQRRGSTLQIGEQAMPVRRVGYPATRVD
jgi:hypothetical protein